MNKWIKIAIVLFSLGLFAGVGGYVFVYNKPHVNYEKVRADHALTVADLFTAYTVDRQLAEQQYNGKVLEITGNISSVDTPDSITVVVFALREGMFGDEGVRCTMLEKYSEDAGRLKPGTMVHMKGFCAGYNDTDIILEKCSITQ